MISTTSSASARRPGRLRQLAIMAAPLAAIAVAACCPESLADEVYLIRDPDPSLQRLIDACRDPEEPDCLPLCRSLSASARFDPIEHCELHQDAGGYTQVHVGVRSIGACE